MAAFSRSAVCIIFRMQFSTWFGFFPMKFGPKRDAYHALGYLVCIFVAVLFLPNAITFYHHAVVDFNIDLALESLLFLSTHFIINTQLYCAIWNKTCLQQLSTSLTQTIVQRMATDSAKYYLRMESLYFQVRKWFAILLFVTTLIIIILPIVFTLNNVSDIGEMSGEIVELPIDIALPFEINSITVYLLVCLVSAISIWSMVICKTTTAEIFYRFGLHLIARCQDIRHILRNFSKINDGKKTNRMPKMERQLIELITLHNEKINFFKGYARVTSGIIFFEFTTLIFLLAAAGGSTVSRPLTYANAIKFNFVVMSAVASMFISSKMGSEVFSTLAEMCTDVYQCGWEKWPDSHRRYVILILMIAQRPRHLSGFGLVACDLNTFVQTLKTIVSFVLVLQEL